MKSFCFTLYHVSIGLESRFNLKRFWFYKSKTEDWFIVALFGIFFWVYPKRHRIF